MSTFFLAVLAGIVWMALLSELGWGTFLTGAGLTLVLRRLAGRRAHRPFSPLRALRLTWLGFLLFWIVSWELLVSVYEQTLLVLSPRVDPEPGWILLETDLETEAMRVFLGVLISLTPGSLVYEESIADDGRYRLALHVVDLRDEAQVVARIRSHLEAPLRVMETL